ncbi:hypothetical protein [Singulisphaera sp. GP187]|uniref:hypothetical protein n=1 Tax=Singulisphaera sp. GP187 TaxID=1882752 RepID=UPI001C1F804A|nr:hypothetical protein [Singulisphaera sp. GP187]
MEFRILLLTFGLTILGLLAAAALYLKRLDQRLSVQIMDSLRNGASPTQIEDQLVAGKIDRQYAVDLIRKVIQQSDFASLVVLTDPATQSICANAPNQGMGSREEDGPFFNASIPWMDELEWLATHDSSSMLFFLFEHPSYSERKMRLFAVACYEQVAEFQFADPLFEAELDAVEKYADSLISKEELLAVSLVHYRALFPNEEESALRMVVNEADYALELAEKAVGLARIGGPHGEDRAWPAGVAESRQALLILDLFGNIFQPVTIDESWLLANDRAVPKLAQAIYEERAFADLPVLADVLEQAGCHDPEILAHCRQQREHYRGCWVLDLLLRKT